MLIGYTLDIWIFYIPLLDHNRLLSEYMAQFVLCRFCGVQIVLFVYCIFLIVDIPKRKYGNKSDIKLDKEEESTLIEAIQAAGDVLRSTGKSADINNKKTRLWNDVMNKINSILGNNRDVKEVNKKWNNLKGSAKARVDCRRREARRTGEVEDENILILNSDKEMSTSVTERVSQFFSRTPTFTGISGSLDLFQPPTTLLPPQTEIIEASDVICSKKYSVNR